MLETDIRRVYGETIFERGMDYFEERGLQAAIPFTDWSLGASAFYRTINMKQQKPWA